MNYGKRCFTDFDAVLEWDDRAWLIFEVKHGAKQVPLGQRLALERQVKDGWKAGKFAVAAVVEHYVDDPREPVYLRECFVRNIYASSEWKWRPPKHPMMARQLLNAFINYVDAGQQWPAFY